MSWVTTVILVSAPDEGDAILFVNKRMEEYAYALTRPFEPVPCDLCAGGKNLESDIYLGSFNGIDELKFLEVVASARWEIPERVQILIRKENEDQFRNLK